MRYFKEIVPGIYDPMLDRIPALAPQTMLVLGECVPAPALAEIRESKPVSRSRNSKLYEYWVDEHPLKVDFEGICDQWESGGFRDAAKALE